MPRRAWMLMLTLTLAMSGCASRNKPAAPGAAPVPAPASPPVTTPPLRTTVLEMKQGIASYYGPGFEGKITASGARFDANSMVAAHPKYPFGTVVRVTNLSNSRAVIVRVVDRGPAKSVQDEGVLIDLSSGAARNLGFTNKGRTRVKLEVLRWGN